MIIRGRKKLKFPFIISCAIASRDYVLFYNTANLYSRSSINLYNAVWLTLIFSSNNEFVVGVIVVRIQLFVVDDNSIRVHAEVIVRYKVFYFRVRS